MFPAVSNATLLGCPSERPVKIRRGDPSGLRHCTVPFTRSSVAGAVSPTNTSPPVGGGPFDTVTVTGSDVVVLPAASRAMAVRVWVLPLAAAVVSHGRE